MEDSASSNVISGHSREQPNLKRGVGWVLLMLFMLGQIIGAGVYVLVGRIGAEVGGAMWAPLLLALGLMLLTACSYAELVTKWPRAGGAATYAYKAFKNPFLCFMTAFVVAMTAVTGGAALVTASAGDYLTQFVSVPTVLASLILITVIALINFWGVSEALKVNAGITVVEIAGLLVIVLIGVLVLANGTGDPGRAFEFKEGGSVPLAILAGTTLAFYAFLGFEDSVNLAEEVRDPRRNYPRALIGALLLAGLIYVLVAFTAAMVVPVDRLAGSSAPLLEIVELGPVPIPLMAFAAIGLLAIANGALSNMIMASRVLYGMGDQSIMPAVFGRVHRIRRTPHVAIVFSTLVSMALIVTGSLEVLVSTVVTLLLMVFVVVNLAVLVARRDPVEHDHFRAPAVVPILGILSCLTLLTQQEGAIWLRVGVLLAVGVVLWFVNVGARRRLDRQELLEREAQVTQEASAVDSDASDTRQT